MTLRRALVLAAACLAHHAGAQHQQFYRWSSPAGSDLFRRQGPLPGYHPEFGTCGSGTTCENACGTNWLSCKASTDLSLFCYNKEDLGQSCCENGSGRACDRGFYCAWNEFGGRVWCCKDGQNRKECGVPDPTTTTTPVDPTDATTVTKTTTTTTTDFKSTTTTTTRTVTEPNDSCPSVRTETVTETTTSVITSVSTDRVTTTETVTVYTGVPPDVETITVYSTVSVTVTVGDGDCNPTSKPHHWPTKPGHPTKPDYPASTSCPPDLSEPKRLVSHSANETTSGPTQTTPALVTGGAGILEAGRLAIVVALAVMFLL